MNISGPAAVAKPEMLFYAPGDLTVTADIPVLDPVSAHVELIKGNNVLREVVADVVIRADCSPEAGRPGPEGRVLEIGRAHV